jgi:hypothetical protein
MSSSTHIDKMKIGRTVVVGLFCLVLLASPVFATSGQSSAKSSDHSQPLSLMLQGMIENAGNQHYEFSGGQLVQGSIDGRALSPTKMEFSFEASVHGLQGVSGGGSIMLPTGRGQHGEDFDARISITSAIPAAVFPITVISTSPPTYSSCDPSSQTCNSEIPLLFTGVATIQSDGGSDTLQIPIAIESPYWNPFGGPIVITSLDSTTNPSIFLEVSYNTASIGWAGVQLQGELAGTFGTEEVSGLYNQVTNSQENLVAGTEFDGGSVSFTGMSDPVLNAYGAFSGHTTFSLAGSFDCASVFGLPEGTCTATGATSDGSFWMIGAQGAFIVGTYHTIWSVPSLFTQTTVLGAVIQH